MFFGQFFDLLAVRRFRCITGEFKSGEKFLIDCSWIKAGGEAGEFIEFSGHPERQHDFVTFFAHAAIQLIFDLLKANAKVVVNTGPVGYSHYFFDARGFASMMNNFQ